MSEQNFDLVVLGAGSGGYAAALRASQLGMSVGLVEKNKVGGTCLHVGCIPTKALLHAGEIADSSRHSAMFGVQTTLDGVDLPRVNAYRDGIVDSKYKGLQGLIKARGINMFEGNGKLVGPSKVVVGDHVLTGNNIILATGSYPKTLPGLDIEGRIITSEQALQLEWIPNKVLVLGGGVIGVEFASVWRSFGSEVTIIEGLPRLVPAEDESISKQFERAYRKRGIKALTGTKLKSASQDENGVTVTLEDGSIETADLLLVAVGRGPNTEGMGFEDVGVSLERGFVKTDERLRTNLPNVFAVGDIVPGIQLAHRGFQHGIFVAEEIAGLQPLSIHDRNIPKVTYSEPEVASVGFGEKEAEEKFGAGNISVYDYNLAGNGKSHILETAGSVKVIRQIDGPVIGVHMIGSRVGELIGEAQTAVNWDAHPEDIAPLLHAHPTQNEALGEALMAIAGKPLHAI